MNKSKWLAGIGFVLWITTAAAMDGEFDRSAETVSLIQQVKASESRRDFVIAAKSIYNSGIGDEALAHVMGEKLLKELPDFAGSQSATNYVTWIMKALGSTGTEYAREVITKIRNKTTVPRMHDACISVLSKIDWQRRKNEIMASRKNFNEGDSMGVAQLLNLLQDSDYTYKSHATYRMSWDKILDERLMDEISRQLQAFLDKNGASDSDDEINAMRDYVKILGFSQNPKSRSLLVSVYKSGVSRVVTEEVKTALYRIDKKKK